MKNVQSPRFNLAEDLLNLAEEIREWKNQLDIQLDTELVTTSYTELMQYTIFNYTMYTRMYIIKIFLNTIYFQL